MCWNISYHYGKLRIISKTLHGENIKDKEILKIAINFDF